MSSCWVYGPNFGSLRGSGVEGRITPARPGNGGAAQGAGNELPLDPTPDQVRKAPSRRPRSALGVAATGHRRALDGGRPRMWLCCGGGCGGQLQRRSRRVGLGKQCGPTDISVFGTQRHSRPGIRCHARSAELLREVRIRDFIPVTSPALTIIDNARRLGQDRLEQTISEADARKVVGVKVLRETAGRHPQVPGAETPLRFTHEQVRYKPDEVLAVLVPVIERLGGLPTTARSRGLSR